MSNKPLVSVVMNCYNSDTYLKEAIDSVIAQTYENWELIFWDNQSTDKSAEIVKSYDDKRIKYFYAPTHTTLGEARNKALEKVNGEYIAFLDCDDLYLPQKIEKTLECFKSDEIGLVYTNGYTLFQDKNNKKAFYNKVQLSGDVFEAWIASYQVMIPSVMFKKSTLANMNYLFDTRFSMVEEFDFFVRMSKLSQVYYLDEKLCIWRAHNDSLSWTKRELFEKENRLFLEDFLRKYPELENENCIQKFKSKIAYHEFYNKWNEKKIIKRGVLKPYLLVDKRLIIIYFLSFFGFKNFKRILKFVGKNV